MPEPNIQLAELPTRKTTGTVDGRYKKQSSDVLRTWSRIPLFNYKTFQDLLDNIPYDCRLIGIEMDDRAEMLHEFEHPKRAIYLLGAEDTGLPEFVKEKCHMLIKLPGNNSLWMEINPYVNGSLVITDQPEQYHFNNLLQVPF